MLYMVDLVLYVFELTLLVFLERTLDIYNKGTRVIKILLEKNLEFFLMYGYICQIISYILLFILCLMGIDAIL